MIRYLLFEAYYVTYAAFLFSLRVEKIFALG